LRLKEKIYTIDTLKIRNGIDMHSAKEYCIRMGIPVFDRIDRSKKERTDKGGDGIEIKAEREPRVRI
jgi:hypothetical protein